MTPERHARIKRLFLEAVELTPEDRGALIDQRCGGDADLRAEVLSLLKYHDPRTLLVDSPAGPRVLPRRVERPTIVPAAIGQADRFAGGRTIVPGMVMSRRLVAATVVTAVLLVLLGCWVHAGVKSSLRQMRTNKLVALRDAQILALRHWLDSEKSKVESWARQPEFVADVQHLAKTETDMDGPALRARLLRTPQQARIEATLRAVAGPTSLYGVTDRAGVIIATNLPDQAVLGTRIAPTAGSMFMRVLAGATVLQKPYEKNAIIRDSPVAGRPPLVVVAPIGNRQGTIIGALAIADAAAGDRFSEILSIARTGRSGETYAFDSHGTMLSESRFNDQLQRLGLIPKGPDSRSSTRVQVRDPGGDLTAGYRPHTPLAARPLTRMARLATAGTDGVDVEGYRDYRGVEVIGAWRWLPREGFGVATEIDYQDAYAPLRYLDTAFGILFGLLVGAVAVSVVSLSRIGGLKTEVGQARKLGQYTLEDMIGEGGIGMVYKARHAMLKRPAAIKLIKLDQISNETHARFEREVQLASGLTHPNTIEIYDYGRTPDGVFYYVMEYIAGLSLAQLARLEGPIPPARTVWILRQIGLSLREAHGHGLVHRDIKPQNVMLCRRGGDADVVKVLDFGLAKDIDTPANAQITATGILRGTPQYIAPEQLTDPTRVDPAVDIYAVGALGYKLLTGTDVFPSRSNFDVFSRTLNEVPKPPSARTEHAIPRQLDALIIQCLAKDPRERPANVGQILGVLDVLARDAPWTQSDARAWWETHGKEKGRDDGRTD